MIARDLTFGGVVWGNKQLKVVSFLFLILLWPTFASAHPVDVASARDLGDTRLTLVSVALKFAASQSLESASGQDCYVALQPIVADIDTIARSILVIDQDGTLICDSFNRVRFTRPDLSDREYVRAGRQLPSGSASLEMPVAGRQSGLGFFPMVVPSLKEGVVAATIDPNTLLPTRPYCSTCGLFVLYRGEVVAASSELTETNNDLVARVHFEGQFGQRNLSVRGFELNIEWRRSTFDPELIYVGYFAKALTNEY